MTISKNRREERKEKREGERHHIHNADLWPRRPWHRVLLHLDIHELRFGEPFLIVSPGTCRIPRFLKSIHDLRVVLLKRRALVSSILGPDPCVPVLKLYPAAGLGAAESSY